MKTDRFACVLTLLCTVGWAAEAGALVAGGGPAASDCYSVFEGVSATTGTRVECADGNPSCDSDSVSGQCTFTFNVCAFQAGLAGCTPQPITAFKVNPVHAANVRLPTVPVSAATCADDTSIVVPLKKNGKKPGKTKVKVLATSSGAPKKDKDKLILKCLPPGPPLGEGCPNNSAGGPRQLDYVVSATGTDLDTGFSGTSHNFPIINGAGFKLCLSECDGSTNPVCKASGPVGAGSLNGETLGPPLPLFAAGTPVCVINRFSIPGNAVQGTVNVQTGEYQSMADGTATPIVLDSVVFSTSAVQVCPECDGGTCDSGSNIGGSCTVDGTVRVRNPQQGIDKVYNLSNKCPPGGNQGARTGVVPINLPLTTGTNSIAGSKPCPLQPLDDQCGTFGATCSNNCDGQIDVKGGINQWCCTDAGKTPCFPTAANSGEPNHAIVRTGAAVAPTPAWPDATYPKTANDAKLVAAFCISDTGSTVVNQVAGIPGPGAVIFNGVHTWLANQ